VLLIVRCLGAQPLLGLSSAAVKFLFADQKFASDARIRNYSSRELWGDGGPLVRASANPPSCLPDQNDSLRLCASQPTPLP
jgi:hypothetical protein